MLHFKALARLVVTIALLMVWSVSVSVACPMAEHVSSASIASGDVACCAGSEDGHPEMDPACETVVICGLQIPNIEVRYDTASGSSILSAIDWPVANAEHLTRFDSAPPGYPPRS
ncbi:hypothetical protein [Hoeflea sp. BAL378]|uniref:hypothetical protein n=1 Tax=Hoeflea sp. BAL378 TaxID=1547437 RepID=UPI001269F4F8|nr:hypothetical protein [Hoeflea sp. BAL378]